MRLEPEHRRLLAVCVARARAHERQQIAAEVEAAVAAERDAMHAKLAEIKANLLGEFFALRDELERVRKEATLLREWRDAHTAHKQARRELLALYRKHALERAWAAERDPAA